MAFIMGADSSERSDRIVARIELTNNSSDLVI